VRFRSLLIGLTAGAVAAVGVVVPAQAHTSQHPAKATVSVLHAVPGVPVDVYVNHHRLLNDFQPGTLAGPLQEPAGTYVVTITAATATNDKNPIIGPLTVRFAGHHDYTIAAHLTAKGAPTATLYDNSLKPTAWGNGRLIVRHDAAAPAVDVLANGAAIVQGLTNPHQAALQVKAGTYSAAVALAGTTKPVIGPAKLPVPKGKDTIVYAWGSAAAGNLALAVQTVTLPKRRPATATVSVLHAVPNTPVDVYVNHKRLLNDFQPGTFAGPLQVKAGTYVVTITGATATNDRKPVIGPLTVRFAGHHDYTIAAHLTAKGAPTATLYDNSLKPTAWGDGRLIVRHDAAAPAVDVLANGSAIVKDLTNPHQAALQVKAGTYTAAVAVAGTTKPVIGPAQLTIPKGKDTIVYAWGSAAAGNLALAVQTVDLRHGKCSFSGMHAYSGSVRW
jgi:hypothetical protein